MFGGKPNFERLRGIPCVLIILFWWTVPLNAQQTQTLDTLVISKEVVISSSRLPQTAAGSGRNITIIPSQMIEEMPTQTVDEVLRYVSGVEVQSRGAFGTQSDLSLRGSTFSQVLVLVDGMRINDPLTAHFNSYIPVAPAEIKHIEVLHGPAAAQYGADAVGGAINIITHTFGSRGMEENSDAGLEVGYGQDDLKIAKGGGVYQNEKYRFGAGGMWHQSPGQELESDYKNRFSIGNISASGGINLNNSWDLAVRSGYDYRDFNARYFYTASPFDDATEKVSAWWNQLQLRKTTPQSATVLKGSFKNNIDRYVFNPQTPANEHTTRMGSLQLNQYRQLSARWDWSYGLQLNRRLIRSTDRGDHSDWHYAAFSMVQWQPSDPFTLSGSLRLDKDESYGTELMPQLSMSFQQEQWILRAAGGRSVRAPSYTERFISTNLEGPLAEGRNIGNPGLEAERSWSGELGADFFPWGNVRFSATGYIRKSSKMIDYVVTDAGQIPNDENLQSDLSYLHAQNINSIHTAGLETELSLSQSLGNGWILEGMAGYTFTGFYGGPDSASKYAATYARHLVNGIVTVQRGAVGASLSGLWKQRPSDRSPAIDAFKTSSYTVWDARLSYRIYSGISVGLQVKNLFDAEYQDVLGASMPGRWIIGSVSWEL